MPPRDSALLALEPLAEAALGGVGRIVRPLFDAFAEPAAILRILRASLDAVAEAADPALFAWSRPPADALVEAMPDLFRGCGMFALHVRDLPRLAQRAGRRSGE